MKELVKRFVQVRSDFLETLKMFPADRTEEVVFGAWNLKQVLAHLVGWDSYFTEIVQKLRIGEKSNYWGDIDKFNEAAVKQRAEMTWDEVYEEWKRASEEFIKEYGDLDEGLWNARFWKQENPTPAWVLKITSEHYEEHVEKITQKIRAWG